MSINKANLAKRFLSQKELAQFEELGYVVVSGLIDVEEYFDPVFEVYQCILDDIAKSLYQAGKIKTLYADMPFCERFVNISKEIGKINIRHFDISLPLKGVKHETPICLERAIFEILRHEGILDVVESIIGPEIYSNPVQRVRIRTPEVSESENESITPWHQDAGVLLPEADDTEMITVWFPLSDTPIEKGCLQVIPQSRTCMLRHHCPGGAQGFLNIPKHELSEKEAVLLPMKAGDVLFMDGYTCHAALPNKSDSLRISFDLRYHPVGQKTGRDIFPGFIARSQKDPASELRNAEQWAAMWHAARKRIADRGEAFQSNRWSSDHLTCA